MKNHEAMAEILAELGIKMPEGTVKQLTDAYDNHLTCMADMQFERHRGGSDFCPHCNAKSEALASAMKQIEVFKNSVKRRRGCDEVWIEGEDVMWK